MAEKITTRRALLKATGALGTIAALAVPVAVLPKAEAAVAQADADLYALWPEFHRDLTAFYEEMKRNDPLLKHRDCVLADVRRNRRAGMSFEDFHDFLMANDPKFRAAVEAIDREWDMWSALDERAAPMRAAKCASLAGILIQGRLLAFDLRFEEVLFPFDGPLEHEDWPRSCLRAFLMSLERLVATDSASAHLLPLLGIDLPSSLPTSSV